MKRILWAICLVAILTTIGCNKAESQTTEKLPVAEQNTLSDADVNLLIDELIASIHKHYLMQDQCDDIEAALRTKLQSGQLYGIAPREVANTLSAYLKEITSDLHFHVGYNPPRPQNTMHPGWQRQTARKSLSKVEILEDNIGYIKWDSFVGNEEAFAEMTDAVGKLHQCDAIIIDVSNNPGGDGRNGGFLNQFLYREKDYQDLLIKRCTQRPIWFRSEVAFDYQGGPNLFDTPIYVLISRRTFSAAEYFAFITQEMKRGLIMGEKTPGGGHPVTRINYSNGFNSLIPECEIQTKDGKEFEGTGIVPDIVLTSDNWIAETIRYIQENKKD